MLEELKDIQRKKDEQNNKDEMRIFKAVIYSLIGVLAIKVIFLSVWLSDVSSEQERRTLPVYAIELKMKSAVFD